MAAICKKSNRIKLVAGAVAAAGSMGLAGVIGPAAVANADPVVILNGEEVEPPPITIPWPGGAWAGHNWRDGWPGGAFNNPDDNKGGGGYLNGVAGGAWNHRN